MATQDFQVTEVPAALDDSLAFVVGTRYFVSNDSSVIVLYRVAVAQPAADATGHPLSPYRTFEFVYAAGADRSWFWTRDPPAALVVTEAGT